MKKKVKDLYHLVFFDGECPLCHRAVRFVLEADKKESFLFSPLQGETAAYELRTFKEGDPHADTLVLLQQYKTRNQKLYTEGRAVLRILWLLGGKYRFLGWMSFLPSGLFDFLYRHFAKRRHRLFNFTKKLRKEITPERLLP